MQLTITCDPAACLAAGIEPRDTLELDLGALAANDRTAIAAIMIGTKVRPPLATPTVEALIEAARKDQARVQEFAAEQAARKAEGVARMSKATEEARAILAARQTTTATTTWYGGLTPVSYTVESVPYISLYDLTDPTISPDYTAWKTEVEARNAAVKSAAEAAAKAEVTQAIATRAAMSMSKLIASLPADGRDKVGEVERLVSDTGREIVLAGPGKAPHMIRYVTASTVGKGDVKVAYGVDDAGDKYPVAGYDIADGVLDVDGSGWAAMVKDPSATKPVYDFLDRCPGGYTAPEFQVGDVLVWGGRDRKGRKFGPYDRLIYAIEPDRLFAFKVDYVTARKLRHILLG